MSLQERDVLLQSGNHPGPSAGVHHAQEDVDEVEVGEVVDASGVAEPEEVVGEGGEEEAGGEVVAEVHPLGDDPGDEERDGVERRVEVDHRVKFSFSLFLRYSMIFSVS